MLAGAAPVNHHIISADFAPRYECEVEVGQIRAGWRPSCCVCLLLTDLKRDHLVHETRSREGPPHSWPAFYEQPRHIPRRQGFRDCWQPEHPFDLTHGDAVTAARLELCPSLRIGIRPAEQDQRYLAGCTDELAIEADP